MFGCKYHDISLVREHVRIGENENSLRLSARLLERAIELF